MEEAKLAILTDAKQEYSSQLINILKTSIYNGIKHLYDESKKKCMAENRFDEVLVDFQDFLSQIRLWSQDMVEQEYKRIEKESDCDFIKELITAVFMSHTQILQVIGSGAKKQTQIDIPKPEHFIHKCYINAGREFYKNPMFFYDGPEVSPVERHRNIPHSETVIATTINETIRQLLPIRRILKSSLQEQYTEIEEQEIPKVIYEEKPKSEPEKEPEREPKPEKEPELEIEPIEDFIVTELSTEKNNEEENQTEKSDDEEREEIFIEDIPELSINDIEEIISKQEYIIPVEKKDEDSENIKKNIIADLDFQEINNENEQEQEKEEFKPINNISLEIKSVEMNDDEKQKLKKQKQGEQEIIIEKQDVNINLEKERAEKERVEKERAEKERAEKERVEKERVEKERAEKERVDNEELTIDTNFDFDEEIDLNDDPVDIDSANISLPSQTQTQTQSETTTTSQSTFKPTTAHKFKFF
jgi:hypothetical protein